MIGLRLPKADIARLDDWARAMGCTRSELIRGLIDYGLDIADRAVKRDIADRVAKSAAEAGG
jgi:Ribbon-helix-helix protein, copG family